MMTTQHFFLIKKESLNNAMYYELTHDLALVRKILFSINQFKPGNFNHLRWINSLYVDLLIYQARLNSEINRRIDLIPIEKLINDLPILKQFYKKKNL